MSYDLTIKLDDRYSRSIPLAPLRSFLSQLPGVKSNGERGFVLDDRPSRWMEIDLEVVNEDGDNIEEQGKQYDQINCIRLHIPYPFLGKAIERDYLPTASAIAQHAGWTLYDEQSGQVLASMPNQPPSPSRNKPWWKFW